ncbi:hypothetical protein LZ24_02143 [Desulfobotulus alkaliphilus]|uniref:GGDEF domain-containing protein n=1 Tax=Desulfobotulus alkaliphilus TaxID=622671 RepID=A0A562RP99_9BACT|nr:hypothetical protein [Desulfobotulus alkaliphilus]TWI70723.1 hypothetical protein LZ24_02143 [Desulfobotulus alkaliphilus]
MNAILPRSGFWAWAFWLLLLGFLLTQFWTARTIVILFETAYDSEACQAAWTPSSLVLIFLRNSLVGLTLPLLALPFFLMLRKKEREAGTQHPPLVPASVESSFARAVYRQRREKKPFALLHCRWKEKEGSGFRKRKKNILSDVLQMARAEIRLTDHLIPIDKNNFAILVEGGAEESRILSARIQKGLDRARGEKEVLKNMEFLWSVASYRPGDSLEELMARALRSLERGIFLEEDGSIP